LSKLKSCTDVRMPVYVLSVDHKNVIACCKGSEYHQQTQLKESELEDLNAWIDDKRAELSASTFLGGLPETAQQQLDAHLVCCGPVFHLNVGKHVCSLKMILINPCDNLRIVALPCGFRPRSAIRLYIMTRLHETSGFQKTPECEITSACKVFDVFFARETSNNENFVNLSILYCLTMHLTTL